MAININSQGSIAYGSPSNFVSVDGAVPAPLAGRTVGLPVWQSDTQLVYQDGGVGGVGPWQLDRLTYPGLTIDTVSATGANFTSGGGGQWMKYLTGEGVTTSDADVGPFASAGLIDVSPQGLFVVKDNYQASQGVTIYDDTGASVFADPNLSLSRNDFCCLRGDILSWQDVAGKWHLYDIANDTIPSWYPRTDGVTFQIPITRNGVLYLVERGNDPTSGSNILTLRRANTAKGWVIYTGLTYYPAAISFGSGFRVASSDTISAATADLRVFDLELLQNGTGELQVTMGTVSGGAIVYGSPTNSSPQTFIVGALEGQSFTTNTWAPVPTAIVGREGKVTDQWARYFRDLDQKLTNLGGVVQNKPDPILASGGFEVVAASGQPPLHASPASNTLTLESSDSSIGIVLNPATNSADLTAEGGSWIPLVDGSEPPNFMTDGAGHLILVAYP